MLLISCFAGCEPCDANCNGFVNVDDIASFVALVGSNPPPPCSPCAGDANEDGFVTVADIGPFVDCIVAGVPERQLPDAGSYALHGRPVDVLSDGHLLHYIRARFYDPQIGRWLQRDPSGYVDGGNLYEAFGSHGLSNVDPSGRQLEGLQRMVDDFRAFFDQFLSPQAAAARAEERYFNDGPPNPDKTESADAYVNAWLSRVEYETDRAEKAAAPYIAPIANGVTLAGGAANLGAGVLITAGTDGLGSPVGYALVMRGTDQALTGASGLHTGVIEPTAVYLIGEQAAGPDYAGYVEAGFDVGLLIAASPNIAQIPPTRGRLSVSSIDDFATAKYVRPGEATEFVSDTVRLFRVEGRPNTRFVIENGNVTVVGDDEAMLWVNIDQPARSTQFYNTEDRRRFA